MAKWSFNVATWTPTAVADTTNFTDSSYMALQGGSSTQLINVLEVYIGGQAGASTPTFMVLARDSTVGGTPTALTTGQKNAALNPATAALAAAQVPFVAASTKPQRSATLGLLNLSLNAFGGIVRWVYSPGEEIGILGNTASLGEVSLSAYTGGTPGLMGTHLIYEPL
jgi:hypothetical protein